MEFKPPAVPVELKTAPTARKLANLWQQTTPVNNRTEPSIHRVTKSSQFPPGSPIKSETLRTNKAAVTGPTKRTSRRN